MSKKTLIIPLFILGLTMIAGNASAAMMTGGINNAMKANVGAGVGIKTGNKQIDIKTAGEIETAFKAERTRCDTMTSDTDKKACYEKIVATLKTKFTNVDESIFRGLIGGKIFEGKAGTNLGYPDDKNKDGKKDDNKDFSAAISGRIDHVIKKLGAINDRLTKVADRIQSRMDKLNSQKIDTAASVKFVASAREELKLATTAANDAQTSYKTESNTTVTVDASNYKTVYAKTIANIKSAKEHLIQAHKYLVQAIANLKPGVNTDLKVKGSADINL